MTTLGVNGIGSSYYTDPYFLYALNSYNPNFMGANTASTGSAATGAETATTTQPASTAQTANPSFEGNGEKSSSNTGLIVAGVAGTAGLLYALKRGNGKGIKAGFKNIWNGITGNKAAQEATEAAASVSNKLRAVLDKKNNLVYTIPGKNKVLKTEAEIRKYAENYGINTKQLQKFNSENSKLLGYEFKIDGNTVVVKDGKINKIFNDGKKDITEKIVKAVDDPDASFLDRIEKQIAKIESGVSGNQSLYKGLTNIEYQTQIGDDMVTVLRKSWNDEKGKRHVKLELKELTTPERFGKDSEALKAYLYNNPEAKQVFLSETLKKGKIPEGVKIESFDYNFSKSIQCKYKDGKLAGIVKDGKYYEKGTDTCDAFLADNEAILNKAIEKLYKKGNLKDFHNAVLVAA